MQIVPAVNAKSFDEVKKQIETASGFADLIHIDVVDGKFAPNVTWGSPEELESIKYQVSGIKFEIHLMVRNPEEVIDAWLRTGVVKRVVVHLEAITDSVLILEKCRKYGAQAMLAINPETEVERLFAHSDFEAFQILAVPPGLPGQQFQPHCLAKLGSLRRKFPDAIIEVDGGINLETARLIKEAGANIAISASYVFGDQDPRGAYERLKAL